MRAYFSLKLQIYTTKLCILNLYAIKIRSMLHLRAWLEVWRNLYSALGIDPIAYEYRSIIGRVGVSPETGSAGEINGFVVGLKNLCGKTSHAECFRGSGIRNAAQNSGWADTRSPCYQQRFEVCIC